MASPVFAPTEAWLRQRLKLSTVDDTSVDTDATIDLAVLEARTDIYRWLGKDRVDTITSGAVWTEVPSTDAELLLALGATTEVKQCRVYLLRTLNPRFLEGSASSRFEWNEAPLMRQQGSFEIRGEIERLTSDVQDALQILRGDVSFGSDRRGGSVFLTSPTETPPKPGRSVWPPQFFQG